MDDKFQQWLDEKFNRQFDQISALSGKVDDLRSDMNEKHAITTAAVAHNTSEIDKLRTFATEGLAVVRENQASTKERVDMMMKSGAGIVAILAALAAILAVFHH